MGCSPGFGSTRRDHRPIQTRCRCGSACCSLNRATPGNSSVHTPKGTRSACASHGLSATDFRVSFTPLAGVLFTVPSRYWCTIGRRGYLALGRGRPCFPPDFACPAVLTLMPHPPACPVTYRTLTFSGPLFQYGSARASSYGRGPCWILPASRSTPPQQRQQPRALRWFGLLPVRSPLLRESSLFLGVREMFQFPRFPPPLTRSVRCLQRGLPHSDSAGSSVASTSPARFVAWPRPSSAPGA